MDGGGEGWMGDAYQRLDEYMTMGRIMEHGMDFIELYEYYDMEGRLRIVQAIQYERRFAEYKLDD